MHPPPPSTSSCKYQDGRIYEERTRNASYFEEVEIMTKEEEKARAEGIEMLALDTKRGGPWKDAKATDYTRVLPDYALAGVVYILLSHSGGHSSL
jgi:hypothetical protein